MYLRLGPYQEVLQGVLVSLQIDEGIIKITGKVGAGKSALCRQLHDDLQANGQPVVLFPEPPASATALQNAITGELQLDAAGNFTRTLSAWLHARDAVSKPLVLIVDDAQKLDPTAFSALRMLCNIQDSAHSLVRIVLCGSDELDTRLGSPALRAVTQFISHSFALPYLTQEQVGNFCQAWWIHNGGDITPFPERALSKLHHDTKGKPGLLCARLEQQDTGAEPAVARIPDAAALLSLGDVKDERKPRRHRMFVLVLVLLLAGATGAWLYFLQPLQNPDANVLVDPVAAALPAARIAPLEARPAALADEPLLDSTSSDTAASETSLDEARDPAPAAPVDDEATVDENPATAPVATADATTTPPVESFIASWITSWQAQDIAAYFTHYHADFAPMQGTRDAWEQQRRRVIGNAAALAISAEALQWNVAAQDGMRVVRFWLHYHATDYADRTLKELVLARAGDEWRIRAERNLRVEQL